MENDEFVFKAASPEEVLVYSDKKLTEIIPSTVEQKQVSVVVQETSESEKVDSDFESVRQNIKDIVVKGNDVLDNMILLAKASDHPRAFEVAGTLINTLVSANKELLEIHEKKNKIKGVKPEAPASQTNVQNNTVFVGSTSDLQDYLLSKK